MATKTLQRSRKKIKHVKKKSHKKMSYFDREMADDQHLAQCSDEEFDKEMQKGENLLKKVLSNLTS